MVNSEAKRTPEAFSETGKSTIHPTWQPCDGCITEHRIRSHADNIIQAYGTIEPQGSIVGG
jgi:hypothetical protein